jgi:hypothetical protein
MSADTPYPRFPSRIDLAVSNSSVPERPGTPYMRFPETLGSSSIDLSPLEQPLPAFAVPDRSDTPYPRDISPFEPERPSPLSLADRRKTFCPPPLILESDGELEVAKPRFTMTP